MWRRGGSERSESGYQRLCSVLQYQQLQLDGNWLPQWRIEKGTWGREMAAGDGGKGEGGVEGNVRAGGRQAEVKPLAVQQFPCAPPSIPKTSFHPTPCSAPVICTWPAREKRRWSHFPLSFFITDRCDATMLRSVTARRKWTRGQSLPIGIPPSDA